jgi:thiopeptide-type bacteriocin biosynthesis protein
VAPLIAGARRSGSARRWFFVRYADPDPHLRIRLQGDPEWLWKELLPAVHEAAEAWLADGHLHRIQLDTYEREVERYGGPEGIELTEAVFEADSDAVLRALPHLGGEAGLDARWRFALAGIDRLLDDLGLDREARLGLLATLRAEFGREFFDPGRPAATGSVRAEADAGRRLGERLRRERTALEALRAGEIAAGSPLAAALPHLAIRAERLRPLARLLGEKRSRGSRDRGLEDLAASFAHMHANRVLRSAQRAHEAVLYDFLWHLDEARRARGLTGAPANPPAESP